MEITIKTVKMSRVGVLPLQLNFLVSQLQLTRTIHAVWVESCLPSLGDYAMIVWLLHP